MTFRVDSLSEDHLPTILGALGNGRVPTVALLKGLKTKNRLRQIAKDLNYGVTVFFHDMILLSQLELASRPQVSDIRLHVSLAMPGSPPLTILAVRLPSGNTKTIADLNRHSGSTIAVGEFNLYAEQDQREHILERLVQPAWIISQQMDCSGCRDNFSNMIWMSKDFYDGTKGWRYLRPSVRTIPIDQFETAVAIDFISNP